MKTISDCLHLIGFGMVEKGRCAAIQNLEDIHNRLLEIGRKDCNQNRIALLNLFKHIN